MAEAAAAWDETNVRSLAPEDHRLHLRMLEAILFAAAEPLSRAEIALRMPEGVDLDALLHELQAAYAGRGVNLRRTDDRWAFRTAEDLAFVLRATWCRRRSSRAPRSRRSPSSPIISRSTRAEIEDVRGVAVSRGHARRAARSRLDPAPRPPAHAGPPRDVRHDAGLPRPFRAGVDRRPSRARGSEGGRADRVARHARRRHAGAERQPGARGGRGSRSSRTSTNIGDAGARSEEADEADAAEDGDESGEIPDAEEPTGATTRRLAAWRAGGP